MLTGELIPHKPIAGPRHPALLAGTIIAAGIVFADHIGWQPLTWLVASMAALVLVVIFLARQRRRWSILPPLSAIVLMFAIGALRLSLAVCSRPPPALSQLMSLRSPVRIEGRLSETPRSRLSGWQAPLEVQFVHTNSGPVPMTARILISGPYSLAGLHYGDRVRFTARLRAPNVRRNPGGFDYADFLFRQGIDGLARPRGAVEAIASGGSPFSPPNMVEPVRTWIRAVFTECLAPTPRALILGFLIGETDQLPPTLYESVRNSGTLHLLAVSGANVWLIVGMAMLILRPLHIRRWLRTAVLLVIVTLFSFLTRNEPSVVRASIMVAAILIGRLAYRPIAALNAIGLSAVIILLISPLQIFRPGFQLSYAAVIAIIVVGARTMSALPSRRHRWRRMLLTVSLSSLAATTATAPILAYHFGTVPIAALPANLVMIPIASVAAYFGAALLACSAVSSWATSMLAYPMTWVLQLFVVVAGFFASIPQAVLSWPQPSLFAIANYFLVLSLILNWRHRYRWIRPVAYYALTVTLFVSLTGSGTSDTSDLVMVFPDLGNRRAAAIGHPNGDLIWLADDPGIDNDLRQWAIDPLVRTTYPNAKSEYQMSWRRSDSLPPGLALSHGFETSPRWSRLTGNLDGATGGKRVWADLFSWNSDTIVLVRDYPKSLDNVTCLQSLRGDLAVLPARGANHRIRNTIESLKPTTIIFYGPNAWAYQPEQWLERWEARFPNVEFWSTMIHGGVILRCGAGGVTICPTIAESGWHDPDL